MSQIAASKGLSPNVDRVRRARGQALPSEGNVRLLDVPRYSRQTIAVGGSTSFTFFNDGPSAGIHVTNLPQPQQFVSNGIYRATHMGFFIQIVGDEDSAADIGAVDIARAKARYYEGGAITISQGDRTVLTDYGLFKWPSGGGIAFTGALATTASTTTLAALSVNNGLPTAGNLRAFRAPIDLTQNDPLIIKVDYPGLIALPSGTTGILMCTVYGDIVKEASAG